MMIQIVPLLVVLVVSSFESVDAVSCYQCNYTNAASLGSSTCSEPFNATNTGNCSAPMCTWQFANFMSFNLVYRDCLNDSISTVADLCEQLRTISNYTTFNYGDSCCFTSGPMTTAGVSYSTTSCFCQNDYCNGNIPLTVAPSKTTNAMSLLKPSMNGKWALVAVTVVWMVEKFIFAG